MTPFNTPEQFAALNKANLENLVAIANSMFARADHLTALNFNTACAIVEDGVAATRSLMALRDVQNLPGLQAKLAEPMIDKTVGYTRGVYEIAANGQQEFGRLFESQIDELNNAFKRTLEQVAKSAPAGSEAMFATIKSSVETANDLIGNATKAARQAAEANLTALTTTVKGASDTSAA
ncbi:MAG: phasin family protein [Proteobacteria bacterium]|nr:phasin family protein [Pseudomonadota bacterium]